MAAGTDPIQMLEAVRGRASDWKLRLVGCATCRDSWRLLGDPDVRLVVVATEKHVDGWLLPHRWERVRSSTPWAKVGDFGTHLLVVRRATVATTQQVVLDVTALHYHDLGTDRAVREGRCADDLIPAYRARFAAQAVFIRDIFGNLFRPVTFAPEWLTPAAVSLADAMYESREFDRMPALADSLEEAGCNDLDVLTHCRSDGPHVRGCWVLESVLGKE